MLFISKVLPQDVAQLENGLKQTQAELSEQKKQVSASMLWLETPCMWQGQQCYSSYQYNSAWLQVAREEVTGYSSGGDSVTMQCYSSYQYNSAWLLVHGKLLVLHQWQCDHAVLQCYSSYLVTIVTVVASGTVSG